MPGAEDFLTAALHHGNLQVDAADPSKRPMIAILDAKPGLEEAFRERIVQLVRAVRREPWMPTTSTLVRPIQNCPSKKKIAIRPPSAYAGGASTLTAYGASSTPIPHARNIVTMNHSSARL